MRRGTGRCWRWENALFNEIILLEFINVAMQRFLNNVTS